MNDTTLSVNGMSCRSCIARLNRALGDLSGVESVDVDLRQGQVRVRHAPELLSRQLIERIAAAGYPAQLADRQDT